MTRMPDPSDALKSFQRALDRKDLRLQRGELDPDLFIYIDRPEGQTRFSYARIEEGRVSCLVILAAAEPAGLVPRFQIGYAVPRPMRHKGRARQTVEAAIAEMAHGLAGARISGFYVEAVVGAENKASQAVAAATLSAVPEHVLEEGSGKSALRYRRKVGREGLQIGLAPIEGLSGRPDWSLSKPGRRN